MIRQLNHDRALCPPSARPIAPWRKGWVWLNGVVMGAWVMGVWVMGAWLSLGGQSSVWAEVTADGTLGTQVRREGQTWVIEGGDRAGANRFHSFDRFSVGAGEVAAFNPRDMAGVARTIARVTGGDPSQIDGMLRMGGTADLFLLNPAGVWFGAGARLDLGGSFLASTAERLTFADGLTFAVAEGSPAPILSMAVPVGLQFGMQPGTIVNGSRSFTLRPSLDPGASPELTVMPTGGLQVQPGRGVMLAAGEVMMREGGVVAPGGAIALVGATAGETVPLGGPFGGAMPAIATSQPSQQLSQPSQQLSQPSQPSQPSRPFQFQAPLTPDLGLPSQPTGGVVRLENGAIADTSGPGGGAIALRGDRITIQDGAALWAATLGDRDGVGIDVRGRRVDLERGATLSTLTAGSGRGGSLTLVGTEAIAHRGQSDFLGRIDQLLQSRFAVEDGLFAVTVGPGAAGTLTVSGDHLDLSGGAIWLTASTSAGRGGDIQVNGGDLHLMGSTIISGASSTGDSGSITFNLRQLNIHNLGIIATTVLGSGRGGDLTVTATDQIDLTGQLVGSSGRQLVPNPTLQVVTVLSSSSLATQSYGAGQAGDLILTTPTLRLQGQTVLTTNGFKAGPSGDISICANTMTLQGLEEATEFLSIPVISNGASGLGSSGNTTIVSDRLRLTNGARIFATTYGEQAAGTVQITVTDRIELIGRNARGDVSQILTGVDPRFQEGPARAGAAGDLRLETPRLILRDGGQISVLNQGPNLGGDMQVVAERVWLDGGEIVAETAGDAGNVAIATDLLVLRNGSRITANSTGRGPGGNVAIAADLVAAIGNSDITANALNANGGRVQVNAGQVLGIVPRDRPTAASDITATSELGPEFAGTITFSGGIGDPVADTLPTPVLLALAPPFTGCEAQQRSHSASFTQMGQGGQRSSLDESGIFGPPLFWEDWRWPTAALPSLPHALVPALTENPPAHPPKSMNSEIPTNLDMIDGKLPRPSPIVGIQPSSPHATRPTDPLTEASGWYQNAQGQVVLGSPRQIPRTYNETCDLASPRVAPSSSR